MKTDLEPLVRGAANEDERRLLESAKSVAARPGARDEMLAALGLAAPAAPERLVARVGRSFGNAGGWSPYGVLLALFIGATGAAVMFGSSSDNASELPAASVPATVPATVLPPAPAQAEGSAQVASAPPVITPDSLPSASAPLMKPSAARDVPPPSGDSLAREIARVEAARSALARNEAARAVEILDSYDREFTSGAFSLEVSVLRIEALARAGQNERTNRLGTRFLAEHPDGPFARRVAATLATLPSP